jgi:hypothetical protein
MKPYGLHNGKLQKFCECIQCGTWKKGKHRKKAARQEAKKEIRDEVTSKMDKE